jgi:hypothetical protein
MAAPKNNAIENWGGKQEMKISHTDIWRHNIWACTIGTKSIGRSNFKCEKKLIEMICYFTCYFCYCLYATLAPWLRGNWNCLCAISVILEVHSCRELFHLIGSPNTFCSNCSFCWGRDIWGWNKWGLSFGRFSEKRLIKDIAFWLRRC